MDLTKTQVSALGDLLLPSKFGLRLAFSEPRLTALDVASRAGARNRGEVTRHAGCDNVPAWQVAASLCGYGLAHPLSPLASA